MALEGDGDRFGNRGHGSYFGDTERGVQRATGA
jgi:hypothetical protein